MPLSASLSLAASDVWITDVWFGWNDGAAVTSGVFFADADRALAVKEPRN